MTDWNEFRGAAKRIEDIDLPRIGERIGVGEDELHAFMDVEAAGSGFDSQRRPKMLFEPHVFYRNLTGVKRSEAVNQGLAYAKWQPGKYPRDSYPRLVKAMVIDETAALKSASWGLGQILGENHKMVGYETVQDMVRAFMDDEEAHLQAMVQFLISSGIDDDLKAHRWEAVARGYNGPAHAKHGYAGKMKAAFAKWRKVKDTPMPAVKSLKNFLPKRPPGIAEQPAAETPDILWVQKRLRELAYPEVGNADGKPGPRTSAAILAFRNDNGLPLSPEVDDDLLVALTKASPRRNSAERTGAKERDIADSPGIQLAKWGKLIGGVATSFGVGGGLVDSMTEDTDRIGQTLNETLATADRVNGVVNTIFDIGPWVGLAAVGIGVLYIGQKFARHLLERYRSGNHV